MTQDLTDAFGAPAVVSLRGLLPPRVRPENGPTEDIPTQDGPTQDGRGRNGHVENGHDGPGGPVARARRRVEEVDALAEAIEDAGELDVDDEPDDALDVDDEPADDLDVDDEPDDDLDVDDDVDVDEAADAPAVPEPRVPEPSASRTTRGAPERSRRPGPERSGRAGGERTTPRPRRSPESAGARASLTPAARAATPARSAVPVPRSRPTAASRATAGSVSAGAASTGSAPLAATSRRWGAARIPAREHSDLLVLLALRRGPADGREVMARLREDSRGALRPAEQTVHRTLHRLVRNHLLVKRPDRVTGRARYALSDVGERVCRSRVRQWRTMVRTVDAVVRASDQD